ncbi:MAG: LCP family protein [Patescibacteria group bacterium]
MRIKHFFAITAFAILGIFATVAGQTLIEQSKDLQIKNMQINTLIDEVGMLDEQTRKVQHTLEAIRKIKIPEQQSTATDSQKIVLEPAPQQSKDETFLLVGTHGNLTDTIILVVTKTETKQAYFISIPRDLSVKGRKINEFYQLFGINVLAQRIEEVTSIKPTKYVVINMEGFEKMIDVIGGIDITVEKNIYDHQYPNKYGGYDPYQINKGEYRMNGADALKYTRSRKSTSDFDRSKRQQQVIQSIKDRLQQGNYLENFGSLGQAYQSLTPYIDTNIGFLELIDIYKIYKEFILQTGNVLSTTNYLYSTMNEKGQYILLPKKTNFTEVKDFIKALTERSA